LPGSKPQKEEGGRWSLSKSPSHGCAGTAVCGSPTDVILVVDMMNGRCAYSMGVASRNIQACTAPIYGKTCKGFAGTLFLLFQPLNGGTTPDMQTYLTTLGLGDLTYIENLSISSAPQATAIEPSFLPNLAVVAGNMSLGVPAGSLTSQPTTIAALPGLKSVQQVGGSVLIGMPPPSSQWALSLTNMESLAGLKCVGGGLGIVNAPSVTSLRGLEALQAVNYAGVFASGPLIILSNTGVSSPSELGSLKGAAKCNSPTPFEVMVQLPAGKCAAPAKFTTSASLCSSISTGACSP
jgi:hypothetical protein